MKPEDLDPHQSRYSSEDGLHIETHPVLASLRKVAGAEEYLAVPCSFAERPELDRRLRCREGGGPGRRRPLFGGSERAAFPAPGLFASPGPFRSAPGVGEREGAPAARPGWEAGVDSRPRLGFGCSTSGQSVEGTERAGAARGRRLAGRGWQPRGREEFEELDKVRVGA